MSGRGFVPPGGDLNDQIAAAKRKLVFGEVAMALGLKGSSRTGWDCPACGGRGTVRERRDDQGGRCAIHSCDKGFDVLDLVRAARGVGARAALAFLERVIAERAARGQPKAPGLFDMGISGGEADGQG